MKLDEGRRLDCEHGDECLCYIECGKFVGKIMNY